MESENSSNPEDLANALVAALEGGLGAQTAAEASMLARTLDTLQHSVLEALKTQVEAWCADNGPLALDADGDVAYAHWEQKNTVVSDEPGLWEFLAARECNPDHYKRPDIAKLKAMLGSEAMEGMEAYVSVEMGRVFGVKRGLLRRPRQAASGGGGAKARTVHPTYHLGPRGIVERARVTPYTPSDPPAKPAAKPVVVEAKVETLAGCGVMPPER